MAKLYIQTQDQENYGAHDWDGEGACPQGWKFKGGEDFFIPQFRGGDEAATLAVMALRVSIEENTDYFRRTIVGWAIVADDFMTDFEQSQLEYEGQITYKTRELAW
jgi:hypothetical protein